MGEDAAEPAQPRPSPGARLTAAVTGDGPRSFAGRARAGRFQLLVEHFPDLADLRVLDLGGEVRTWLHAPVRPREVTLLNLGWMADLQQQELDELGPDGTFLRAVGGDACDLPPETAGYDLVYSNSVIEHVGGLDRRRAFADGVRRAGTRHWVQTPNRYFPIEPHWLFPGFQFLPVPVRLAVQDRWPVGHFAGRRATASEDERLEDVLQVELIGRTEFAHLFAGSTILAERVGPLTKSWIAVG